MFFPKNIFDLDPLKGASHVGTLIELRGDKALVLFPSHHNKLK
jgi:hypothetical protein